MTTIVCGERVHNDIVFAVSDRPRARVLLVDDDELWTPYLTYILEAAQFQVVADTDPISAIERFRQDPDFFDVIITDLDMPHLTGRELARQLLEIKPGLHVIGMTGSCSGESPESEAGLNLLVAKDEAADRITHHLRDYIRRKK